MSARRSSSARHSSRVFFRFFIVVLWIDYGFVYLAEHDSHVEESVENELRRVAVPHVSMVPGNHRADKTSETVRDKAWPLLNDSARL